MRYPGGKSYIIEKILPYFEQYISSNTRFVDVFAGGLTVTSAVADAFPQITHFHINDKDPGIASIWTCYLQWPANLKAVLRQIDPSLENFYAIRNEVATTYSVPDNPGQMIQLAAKKIFLHQCSYSGLGVRGGPQGGNHQTGFTKIASNWNLEFQNKKINEFKSQFENKNFKENNCSCEDFEKIILSAKPNDFLYLDPPYFLRGKRLYQFFFKKEQHQRLAAVLKISTNPWVLSYDDMPYIRELYAWANINTIVNANRMQMVDDGSGRKAAITNELVITPKY